MSLKVKTGPTDLTAFQEYVRDSMFGDTRVPIIHTPTGETNGYEAAFLQSTGLIYYPATTPLPDSGQYTLSVDPSLLDFTKSGVNATKHASPIPSILAQGQYNPETGAQRLYGRQADADDEVLEISTTTLAKISDDVYSGLTWRSGGPNHGSPSQPTFPRGWYTGTRSRPIIFEHAINGIWGETTYGTNIYPQGLMAIPACDEISIGADNDFDNNHAWIDIDTGLCVGIMFAEGGWQESDAMPVWSVFAGAQLTWVRCQFVADTDSVALHPKGQLVWTSDYHTSQDVGSPKVAHAWIRVTDFNPNATLDSDGQGGVERVHGRTRLFTRMLFDLEPILPGGNNVGPTKCMRHPHWVPSLGLYALIAGEDAGTPPNGEMMHKTWITAPELAEVSPPGSAERAETNSIVTATCRAGGDVGEIASGKAVTFVLERISTQGEVLTTGGGTSTVANIPVDPSPRDFTVYQDGTPLVDPTDYTVVLATGVITWAGSHPVGGSAYTVDYHHQASPATPPHGTLLAPDTVTDENGVATTQIRYPDTAALAGQTDQLGVTVPDD